MNRREKGTFYEKKSVSYLQDLGYQLCALNYRTRVGEIDVIVKDRDTFVFVEVKSLLADLGFRPSERVDHRKQQKIRTVAMQYMIGIDQYEKSPMRFDVIEWQLIRGKEEFQHYINAF
jgi:putative endonuclease